MAYLAVLHDAKQVLPPDETATEVYANNPGDARYSSQSGVAVRRGRFASSAYGFAVVMICQEQSVRG